MHVVFLNPQGNFDPHDAHLTEHPDFGGQLVYVKEISMALATMGVKVDIVTRQIDDPDWPEFSEPIDYYPGYEDHLRILRIPCGGPLFLNKEQLWDHLGEFVDNLVAFYGDTLPDFATGHYADGGYCGVLLQRKAGLGFTFTGHSLGAQKLDKLGMNPDNAQSMEQRFLFSRRIDAERLSMGRACTVITSTSQERFSQYSHPLYQGAVEVQDDAHFAVIPPGVNTKIFTTAVSAEDQPIQQALAQKAGKEPHIVVSSRLDEKKNIIGVVKAYALSRELQEQATLVLCVRGVDDPWTAISNLSEGEQAVLRPILDTIEEAGLKSKVLFLNIPSQRALAASYRFFAQRGSVFALTAFYEPFGLAPIEAAACGLAVVATQNGGPAEIFEDGSGILVDPFDSPSIAKGLLQGIQNYSHFSALGQRRVETTYTWERTAKGYLRAIEAGFQAGNRPGEPVPELNAQERIARYIATR